MERASGYPSHWLSGASLNNWLISCFEASSISGVDLEIAKRKHMDKIEFIRWAKSQINYNTNPDQQKLTKLTIENIAQFDSEAAEILRKTEAECSRLSEHLAKRFGWKSRSQLPIRVLLLTCILLFIAFVALKAPGVARRSNNVRRSRRWDERMKKLSDDERKLPWIRSLL